ncbi:hypothetical protein [Aeromonas media]|uniref:hypothetical protein n=1 Tax=Aeromonas media TaxID=651 RepID=UPI0022806D73|nr:hypothetical protein [Aeromonas media]MCY9834715.1 hypothetical protein [Aeromonas media]
MAENIAIKVPGKHQQTGEYGADEFKGQRIDIDELAMPFLIHGRGMGTSLIHIPSGYRITPFGGWQNTVRCRCDSMPYPLSIR